MKNPRDVILKPVVSEKSYALLDENTYTFIVDPDANKTEIKEAIQAIFSVRVANVNTHHRKGQRKRTRRPIGVRTAPRRALVTVLAAGGVEIFEAR